MTLDSLDIEWDEIRFIGAQEYLAFPQFEVLEIMIRIDNVIIHFLKYIFLKGIG